MKMKWTSYGICLLVLCGLHSSVAAQDTQIKGVNGWVTTELFTVGESFSGYFPPGILDGLGAYRKDANTVRVLANHELTTTSGYAYALASGATPTGARVSYFDIDMSTRQVVDAGLAFDTIIQPDGTPVLPGEESSLGAGSGGGIARLCSSMFVSAGTYGFVDNIYFTGEEDSSSNGGNGGYEYALDVANHTLYTAPQLGWAAWENVTPLNTGVDTKTALLIGDDRGGAPLYLWVGDKQGTGFLERNGLSAGTLYAWASDTADVDPADFNGTGASRTGKWAAINPSTMTSIAAQQAYAESQGAFKFSRPEDVATDPMDGTRAVMASTGLGGSFPDDNWGTTYLIDVEFDSSGNPAAGIVSILYDGDDAGAGQFAGSDFGLRSPDNLDWSEDGYIYIQEDRSTSPSSLFGGTSGEEASIWQLDPRTGVLERIAQMDRSAMLPAGQVDTAPTDLGNWESSGVLDVSSLFGEAPGSLFVIDVQAHSVREGAILSQNLVEGGQLLLLSVPEPGSIIFAWFGLLSAGVARRRVTQK